MAENGQLFKLAVSILAGIGLYYLIFRPKRSCPELTCPVPKPCPPQSCPTPKPCPVSEPCPPCPTFRERICPAPPACPSPPPCPPCIQNATSSVSSSSTSSGASPTEFGSLGRSLEF